MEKETILEIEFIPVWDKWAWRITKNELFDKEEGLAGYTNKENTIELRRGHKFSFFYSGKLDTSYKEITNDILLSEYMKKELELLVKQANEEFGKPKRWRAEHGEEYCFINATGKIERTKEYGMAPDDIFHEFGNYFRTEEQAKKALERVKKALQEVEE